MELALAPGHVFAKTVTVVTSVKNVTWATMSTPKTKPTQTVEVSILHTLKISAGVTLEVNLRNSLTYRRENTQVRDPPWL